MSVTVANIPGALQKEKKQTVQGTCSSSGLNTIIAAPASNQRIVITAFTVQQASATGTLIQLCSDGSAKWRFQGVSNGDMLTMVLADNPLYMGRAKAFKIKLDGANAISYSIQYYIEQVCA